MKDRLKNFDNIRAIFLNEKLVLGYTLFEDYVSFKYQDDNDGILTKNVFFREIKKSVNDGIYTVEEGFRKEGKSSFIFKQELVIKIKSF